MEDAQTKKIKGIIADAIVQALDETGDHVRFNFEYLAADKAFKGIYDYLTTPYADENHQGGNLIDALMMLVTENHKLTGELNRLRNA